MKEVKQPGYFIWRNRHPSEKKAATWAGGIDTWVERDDGSAYLAQEGQAQPPDALEKAGFTFDDFMSAIAASAVRDMEAANAERDLAVERMTKAMEDRAAATEEVTKLRAERDSAVANAARAAQAALDARATAEFLAQELQTSNAKVAELTAPSEDPANPVLHAITFGLFGN